MMSVDFEAQVANLVNQERVSAGLAPLRYNPALSNVARMKSQDMIDHAYFSHQSPVFGNPFEMLMGFGIPFRAAAENIAEGQQTPQAVMNDWMNSPGHRQNILNPGFTELGVGYAVDAQGTPYWTQLFISR